MSTGKSIREEFGRKDVSRCLQGSLDGTLTHLSFLGFMQTLEEFLGSYSPLYLYLSTQLLL